MNNRRGLLWYVPPNDDLTASIITAVKVYRLKHGRLPTEVCLSPGLLPPGIQADAVIVDAQAITILPVDCLPPRHMLIGTGETQ